MSVFSPGNGINNMAGYVADCISLEFSQTGAGVGHGAVVRGHLGAVAAQENPPVIRHMATHQRDQFRVD